MFINIDQVKYHVKIVGNGPALLLLHGFTGDLSQWEPFIESWQQKFKIIAVDIIGHGKTSAPHDVAFYDMDYVADQLVRLIKELDIIHINILGYSMGGRLALTIAEREPLLVSALLLEGSSPGLKTKDERDVRIQQDERLATLILEQGLEQFIEYWEKIPLFLSQQSLQKDVRRRLTQQRLQNSPIGLANSLRGMGTGQQRSLWERLSELDMPVLLVVGELDKKFMDIANQMNMRFINSQISVVKGAGHTVHLEEPKIFDKIVIEQFIPLVQKGLMKNDN